MNISVANDNDVPDLCLLLQELFAQEVEFVSNFNLQTQGLKQIIANPDIGTIFLARKQQEVLGMVSLLYTISTALGAKVALLEDMVVTSTARHQGIGSELIAAAMAYAKQQGCQRITLLTDANNHSAQQFYARNGFTASTMLPMRLSLSMLE